MLDLDPHALPVRNGALTINGLCAELDAQNPPVLHAGAHWGRLSAAMETNLSGLWRLLDVRIFSTNSAKAVLLGAEFTDAPQAQDPVEIMLSHIDPGHLRDLAVVSVPPETLRACQRELVARTLGEMDRLALRDWAQEYALEAFARNKADTLHGFIARQVLLQGPEALLHADRGACVAHQFEFAP